MKYKSILEKKSTETKKREARQKKLRKKYRVSGDKVIVERGIGLWHFWQIGKECVRIAAAGIFFFLAFVGMVGLVYAEPREALYKIWKLLCEEAAYELTRGIYR